MSKISREDNKKRFKTGMYPTQQDFENVFDSYVHKDDTIDPSKIVSGNENIVDIINRKAEERHNHPISEVDNLGETLQQIQDDLDTAEDNIAGHETRIVTLEAAKTDYEAFKERVRAFLEDANASDTTIDRWHEIENFLQGITDTETLTGLLNDLKQEILGSIPEPQTGNYLELVDDLDAYTDAPDGKIVKYVGQTNEKYTRGFDYERVAGALKIITKGTAFVTIPENSYGLKPSTYYNTGVFVENHNCWVHGGTSGTACDINRFDDVDGESILVTVTGKLYKVVLPNITEPYHEDCYSIESFQSGNLTEPLQLGQPSTWQPIPSFNVIN